jgi:hypothetical protein
MMWRSAVDTSLMVIKEIPSVIPKQKIWLEKKATKTISLKKIMLPTNQPTSGTLHLPGL